MFQCINFRTGKFTQPQKKYLLMSLKIIKNKNMKVVGKVVVIALTAVLLVACDKLDEYVNSTSSGGGSDSNSASSNSSQPSEIVKLGAFNEFKCTSNWTNRDGGLGLKVGSGSGTCKAPFHGESGIYRIELLAQTEREGRSPYRISINGTQVNSGRRYH
jgi:hypothetical protein